MYSSGRGGQSPDPDSILWLFRLSAEQGHADGQFVLGVAYARGQTVTKDLVTAHMWLDLAAAGASLENRARYTKTRNEVAEAMTSDQLVEARRRASEWQRSRGSYSS